MCINSPNSLSEFYKLFMRNLLNECRSHAIMILVNWDGYSNNGLRATGLFPLQPAPLQVGHQEYIGSMGASYIQYIITDQVTSPIAYEEYYDEKVY